MLVYIAGNRITLLPTVYIYYSAFAPTLTVKFTVTTPPLQEMIYLEATAVLGNQLSGWLPAYK